MDKLSYEDSRNEYSMAPRSASSTPDKRGRRIIVFRGISPKVSPFLEITPKMKAYHDSKEAETRLDSVQHTVRPPSYPNHPPKRNKDLRKFRTPSSIISIDFNGRDSCIENDLQEFEISGQERPFVPRPSRVPKFSKNLVRSARHWSRTSVSRVIWPPEEHTAKSSQKIKSDTKKRVHFSDDVLYWEVEDKVQVLLPFRYKHHTC